MPLVLVTGGTRSGKSELAERLAADAGDDVVYVATGRAVDEEMAQRIAAHRARRPVGWRTVEGTDPVSALRAADGQPALVDSLGGWLTALMEERGLLTDDAVGADGREAVLARVRELARAAAERPALTVVVAEESGLGPVAVGAGTRRYLDLAGEAAQVLSAAAAEVLLVVAGRAVELTPPPVAGGHEAELRLHGDTMVPPGAEDFAVNVLDGVGPAWLEDALREALAGATAYPDEREAAAALAERHGRTPEEVVVTNGSAEALWLMAGTLRPRRAVCVHPSFTEPEAALRAHGRPVERVFRDAADFALEPEAVPRGADLVTTANPNNPTGTLDSADALAGLAARGRTLVVDEAFMDFVPGESESLAAATDVPGLVVVRSLTKLWSLAGVRAGYVLAPRRLAAALRHRRPPWNANSLALAALRACAARPDAAREAAERVAAARAQLRAALDALPSVRTWPSAANFLLARVPDGERAHRALLQHGFAVRPARTFPGLGADHLRITVRAPAANDRLVGALREVLA